MSDTVPEPILEQAYWRERLAEAKVSGQLHHAVFICHKAKWDAIAAKHRQILDRYVHEDDYILDAGCGWGRLIDLLPARWRGQYLGVDLSFDFIDKARSLYPQRNILFVRTTLDDPIVKQYTFKYDLGVLVSIRSMILRHLGAEKWAAIEANLRACCQRLLYLEYDETSDGEMVNL